jgi:hypothetical protein
LCWLHSVGQNHFYVMFLLYPESTLWLCSSRRFCEVFKEVYFSSLSAVRMTWSSVPMLISQQHPSGRRGIPFGRSSVKASSVRTTRTFRPDALQSSRRSQCSSLFVRTTWLYRPDAIQCLTSIRVSASRHNYGKTATTIRKMSSIR